MIELTIASTQNGKGRSFSATLVGAVLAPGLTDARSSRSTCRPAFLMLAASDREWQPFRTNLVTLGRPADVFGTTTSEWNYGRVECAKALGYKISEQKNCGRAGQTLAKVYVTSLCSPLLVGDAEEGASFGFVLVRGKTWLAERVQKEIVAHGEAVRLLSHARSLGIVQGEARADAAWGDKVKLCQDEILAAAVMATSFAQYLDRRTSVPLIPDRAFYLQLYLAALVRGLASLPPRPEGVTAAADHWTFARNSRNTGLVVVGEEMMQIVPPVGVMANETNITELAAKESKRYADLAAR